jgi:hypothetical protein
VRTLTATIIFLVLVSFAAATEGNYLYRAELVQAAPGKILELIDLYKTRASFMEAAGDAAPFSMRHSQGDHWDLLFLYPMKSYADFYSAERIARRAKGDVSTSDLMARIHKDIAWEEDIFLYGPAFETMQTAFKDSSFYHVEMLHALPGKQPELRKEREMESAYQKFLGRPEIFVFVRDQGAEWDVLSIDFYQDLQQYAGCSRNGTCTAPSKEKQQAAAHAAGYADEDQIGPYLRSVIAYHHDTLAVALTPAASK